MGIAATPGRAAMRPTGIAVSFGPRSSHACGDPVIWAQEMCETRR